MTRMGGIGALMRRSLGVLPRGFVLLGLSVVTLAAILVVFSLAFCFARLPRLKSLHGEALAYTDLVANEDLALLAAILPQTATDICFFYQPHVQVIEVDFAIGEDAFLEWASAKEWRVRRIEDMEQALVLPLSSAGTSRQAETVRRGYVFFERRFQGSDTGQRVRTITHCLDVVFDSAVGQAHLRFTGGAMKERWAQANLMERGRRGVRVSPE